MEIKTLSELLGILEEYRKESRISAETTNIQLPIAVIYELLVYETTKQEQKVQKLKKTLATFCRGL